LGFSEENRARTVLAILPSVWGLGFGGWSWGFGVLGVVCGDGGLELEVWDLGIRIWGLMGFRGIEFLFLLGGSRGRPRPDSHRW
jgi:hypothetical protein